VGVPSRLAALPHTCPPPPPSPRRASPIATACSRGCGRRSTPSSRSTCSWRATPVGGGRRPATRLLPCALPGRPLLCCRAPAPGCQTHPTTCCSRCSRSDTRRGGAILAHGPPGEGMGLGLAERCRGRTWSHPEPPVPGCPGAAPPSVPPHPKPPAARARAPSWTCFAAPTRGCCRPPVRSLATGRRPTQRAAPHLSASSQRCCWRSAARPRASSRSQVRHAAGGAAISQALDGVRADHGCAGSFLLCACSLEWRKLMPLPAFSTTSRQRRPAVAHRACHCTRRGGARGGAPRHSRGRGRRRRRPRRPRLAGVRARRAGLARRALWGPRHRRAGRGPRSRLRARLGGGKRSAAGGWRGRGWRRAGTGGPKRDGTSW
jgi:hypothetical protein